MHTTKLAIFFTSFNFIFLLACGKDVAVDETPSMVRPVKLTTIEDASKIERNRFPAFIDASIMSDLSMPVGGKLIELPIKEAQEIKSGAIIAKLDQRDFLASAEAAEAEFNNANSEYKRAEKLAKENAISASVLQQRRAQRDVAKAQLDSAQKALSDTVLRAPFDGVVAQIPVKKLQTISAGTIIAVFMSTDSFKATIDLPASYIARIPKNENSKASDRKAFVILDAAPTKIIEATFTEASLIADTASQTYAVTFSFFPPSDLTILPGMNATVELVKSKNTNGTRVSLPLDAVLSDGENQYVWLVEPKSMQVNKQIVSIEEGVGKTVVVTKGLTANQVIVGAGASYLSEGMKVSEWKN